MKKKYEKPQIYVENFYLAEHIAACDWVWNQGENACPAEASAGEGPKLGVTIFTTDMPCDMQSDENTCYFAPDGQVILSMS